VAASATSAPTIALDGTLLLIGCGKMGGALLGGWLERGVAARRVIVVEPQAQHAADFAARGVRVVPEIGDLDAEQPPAVAVLAVKPQQMDAVLAALPAILGPETLILSIAAGKTLAYFARGFGEEAAIVRAMPNTPAAINRGMSVLCANSRVGAAGRRLAAALMAAAGEVAWIDDEALMDPVTAVSGGGPAYVFLLIECLAEAGIEAGLPEDLAHRLARVTVAGSGELVRRSAERPSHLRENVTSPGGTTLEALKVLMAPDGLQPLMTRAIAAASRRSRELAS
jgi:pyrroline-5-carboxylate reductase